MGLIYFIRRRNKSLLRTKYNAHFDFEEFDYSWVRRLVQRLRALIHFSIIESTSSGLLIMGT